MLTIDDIANHIHALLAQICANTERSALAAEGIRDDIAALTGRLSDIEGALKDQAGAQRNGRQISR